MKCSEVRSLDRQRADLCRRRTLCYMEWTWSCLWCHRTSWRHVKRGMSTLKPCVLEREGSGYLGHKWTSDLIKGPVPVKCVWKQPVCCYAVSFTPGPALALCPSAPRWQEKTGSSRDRMLVFAGHLCSADTVRCVCVVVHVDVSTGTSPAHAQAEGLGIRVHPGRSWTNRWREQG